MTDPVPVVVGCVHEDKPAGHPLITLPPVGELPAEVWCYAHRAWEPNERDRT